MPQWHETNRSTHAAVIDGSSRVLRGALKGLSILKRRFQLRFLGREWRKPLLLPNRGKPLNGREAMTSFCLPPLPDEPEVQVVAKWRNGIASLAEVMAIRQLLPAVRNWPVSQAFEQARASSGWVLVVCHPARALRAVEEAERVGLTAVVEPFEPRHGETLEQIGEYWGCEVPPSWWPR
jgi:hypothetical protein